MAPADLHDPTAALDAVLRAAAPSPVAGIDAWWIRHLRAAGLATAPIDRTIVAAARMDRLAYALASAHVEAIEQLVPVVGTARIALCTDEAGERAPPLRLVPDGEAWRLFGEAPSVLLGAEADELLVIARGALPQGERMVAVDVPARRPGVGRQALSEEPLPRGRVRFEGVRVDATEVLEGDGQLDFARPLETIADAHAHAALATFLHGVGGRAGWPRSALSELLAHVVAARALALADPRSPAVHLALAGHITQLRLLVEDCRHRWDELPHQVRRRWDQDRVLLDEARTRRAARLEAAWEAPLPPS